MDATPLSPAPVPPSQDTDPVDFGPEPYRIHIPTRYLELTQQKFDNARLPAELADADDASVREEVDALIDHWHETYSWRHEESVLNTLPQFRCAVSISPFGVLRHHFLWHRSSSSSSSSSTPTAAATTATATSSSFSTSTTTDVQKQSSESNNNASKTTTPAPAPPILLLGEFWEFLKLFKQLQKCSAADVVLPSPPGMGFSDAPASAGFGVKECAEGYHELMASLGYSGYVLHASGTLGISVAQVLAQRWPDEVQGMLLCELPPLPPPRRWWARTKLRFSSATGVPWPRAKAQKLLQAAATTTEGKEKSSVFLEYALTDSPMGLLSWVQGRIRGGATSAYEWTYSDIITAFMYYWISGPRDYFRLVHTAAADTKHVRARVKIGLFLAESQRLPKLCVEESLGPVVFERTREAPVGRWTAWEEPEALAEALREFLDVVRQ